MPAPKAFISYSWDDDGHKGWVAQLATRLRNDGVEVILDQWHAVPGDQLPEFMEREIRENDYVLIICTPKYKQKSDNRSGGVGYEGDIITGEIFSKGNHRKFIPILARVPWDAAAPTWLKGKYFIDLSTEPQFEKSYEDLLTTMLGTRPQAPPVRKRIDIPVHQGVNVNFSGNTFQLAPFEPIKILGVIVDEVSQPRLDGTQGSALYKVPFRLSRTPSGLWRKFFIREWNFPRLFTIMHRPDIASVSDDKVILDGTTIEEIKKYHRDTLVLCVNKANKEEEKIININRQKAGLESKLAVEHKTKINEISKSITFD